MAEFIYTMIKARKTVGDKVILDDVTMSFFPGAKIGMVGPNGAGKSTILKIMAGLDTPSNGEATLTAGFTVGILMQEPELDESRSVLENVQDGVLFAVNGLVAHVLGEDGYFRQGVTHRAIDDGSPEFWVSRDCPQLVHGGKQTLVGELLKPAAPRPGSIGRPSEPTNPARLRAGTHERDEHCREIQRVGHRASHPRAEAHGGLE
jgi:energy-coupling factor transporter ATP-binding protein EcfA2